MLSQFETVQGLLRSPNADPGLSDYAREIDQNIIDLQNTLNSIDQGER